MHATYELFSPRVNNSTIINLTLSSPGKQAIPSLGWWICRSAMVPAAQVLLVLRSLRTIFFTAFLNFVFQSKIIIWFVLSESIVALWCWYHCWSHLPGVAEEIILLHVQYYRLYGEPERILWYYCGTWSGAKSFVQKILMVCSFVALLYEIFRRVLWGFRRCVTSRFFCAMVPIHTYAQDAYVCA